MPSTMQISTSPVAYTLLACWMASALLLSASSEKNLAKPEMYDWPVYGGAPENIHYSLLTQINRTNVKQLEVAWSFDSGGAAACSQAQSLLTEYFTGSHPHRRSSLWTLQTANFCGNSIPA